MHFFSYNVMHDPMDLWMFAFYRYFVEICTHSLLISVDHICLLDQFGCDYWNHDILSENAMYLLVVVVLTCPHPATFTTWDTQQQHGSEHRDTRTQTQTHTHMQTRMKTHSGIVLSLSIVWSSGAEYELCHVDIFKLFHFSSSLPAYL